MHSDSHKKKKSYEMRFTCVHKPIDADLLLHHLQQLHFQFISTSEAHFLNSFHAQQNNRKKIMKKPL